MKLKLFAITLAAALLLSGCGSVFVDLNTPKSSELKEEYDFYQKSVDNIRTTMKVTPEEADEIFIILCNSGVSDEINYVTDNNDGTFSVWSSGDKYIVTLDGASVDTIVFGKKTLYPVQEESEVEETKETETAETAEVTVEPEEADQSASDFQTTALKYVQSAFGKDNVVNVTYVEENNFLSIEAKGKENLTGSMTLRGMYMGMENLLEDFSENENIDIKFTIYYPLSDQKGNVEDIAVIRAKYSWDTRKDINWDNFLTKNIPAVADEWFLHSAFDDAVVE